MQIKYLAQGNNILLPGFKLSTSVFKTDILPNRPICQICLPLVTHTIMHQSFADDLQLQMSVPPDRIYELLHFMQSCISDVKAWATVNMLKLDDNKT